MQWGIASVLCRLFSTVGDNITPCRGITLVLWGNNIRTVQGLQYCGGIASIMWRITAVHVGDSFSTMGIPVILCHIFYG